MTIQIGAMNNPRNDVLKEIEWIAKNGFDFIDLTVEPISDADFDLAPVKKALRDAGIGVIGHTTPFLPFALPVKDIQDTCLKEFRGYAQIFSKLGAEYVNIHPSYALPFGTQDALIDANITFFRAFEKIAKQHGFVMMIENFHRPFDNVKTFERIFSEIPDAKMHLDIGHANLVNGKNQTPEFFRAFKKRIVHLHASDNDGDGDWHMPIGCGNIDWNKMASILKKNNYNRTITLEIHADKEYLLLSREKFCNLW